MGPTQLLHGTASAVLNARTARESVAANRLTLLLQTQVAFVCDAYFFDKVSTSCDGIRVFSLGSAEAYAAALADPETRWRKPVTLVHTWLDRLKEHYEVRGGSLHCS